MIDNEVAKLLQDAYSFSTIIVQNAKDFIAEGADLLKENKIIYYEDLISLIRQKYSHMLDTESLL